MSTASSPSLSKSPRRPSTSGPTSTDAASPTPDSEATILLHRVPGRSGTSSMPVWKAIGYTLEISAKFLWSTLRGQGSVALGDRLLQTYWTRILSSGSAELRAIGRHHFQPGKAYVVMSNHGSLIDIPILMGTVPGSLRMVLKEELTKLPIWGRALLASGFVPVDRKNRDKAIAQLEKAKGLLDQGVSVWISPEGTRARDGLLAPFKKGGFHVAKSLGVPIIPAWIEGASSTLPADTFQVRMNGTLTATFGEPIETGDKSIDELLPLVRTRILGLSGRADEVDATRQAATESSRAEKPKSQKTSLRRSVS